MGKCITFSSSAGFLFFYYFLVRLGARGSLSVQTENTFVKLGCNCAFAATVSTSFQAGQNQTMRLKEILFY